MLPPSGRRRSWAHYGLMMPNLPAPHRFFNIMSIVGTPGVRLFANDDLITTTPNDTAYVVSATSRMTDGQFRAYRIAADCTFAADGSHLEFGDDLLIQGKHPRFAVYRVHPEAEVRLTIEATDVVTHFVRLPGVYRHWSLFCRAHGTVGDTDVDGLCTLEYACGIGPHSLLDRRLPNLPASLFTYQVLNVDNETQLLFTHVRGPGRLPIQRAVHVRTSAGAHSYHRGHEFLVHDYETRTTPRGRTMSLPKTFTWHARGVGEINGTSNSDWTYGLGAGYVGSYEYVGTFQDRAITGCAYIEYIDLR